MIHRHLAGALALAAAAACTSPQGGAQDTGYARDADSGAAAPATQSRITPMQPPDSTTGVSSPTGAPGSAGIPAGVKQPDANIAQPDGRNPRP